jgi:hypothetical protein
MAIEKKKLEVVQLNLGVNINPNPGIISKESKEKIDILISNAIQEKEAMQINLLSESDVKKCYEMLIQATNIKGTVSGESMLTAISNKTKLATLIIRLRQYTRERGDIWEIQKHHISNVTRYSMKPKF